MIAQFQDWMMTLCLFMEQLISGYFFYDSRMRPQVLALSRGRTLDTVSVLNDTDPWGVLGSVPQAGLHL